jgi:hypothetical protein
MMIMSQRSCACGKHMAGLSIDCIIPEEVIAAIYCPEESKNVRFDQKTMVNDNGWIIEYDMEIARFYAQHAQKEPDRITPEFLFLEGLASWTGMTPTDQVELPKERDKIVRLRDQDPKRYMEEFRKWAISRNERMKKEGWKKAK